MAAPMQQMPGQLMPQQQNRFGVGVGGQGMDFGQYAFQFIQNTPYVGPGWQTTVAITERVGKAQDLITSAVLATPNQPWQRLAQLCLQFEQQAFRGSPDKGIYDQKMRQKSAEMHARRQGQVPQLQESMNAQAAQRQQQIMMMNQRQQQAALIQAQMAGRGGGPNQTGFQHLQNPMQVSQLSQQPPQMGLGLGNGMNQQMNPGQPGFPMPQAQMLEQQQLTDADKQKIQALAHSLMQQASEAQKHQMLQNLTSRLPPQRLAQMRAEGQNPLAMLFQQEATKRFLMARRHQMQKQGMHPNTPGMQMQPGPQRPMNPNMMNNMGQQGGQMGPYGNNMESIMNEQKQGLLAEQQGQLVVPASSGPGRNATPQPLSGMQPQNMFPQGQNQTPRPQMPNGFDLQQQQQQLKQHMAASQAQAQLRAQAQSKGLQGQPGGLSGPMPASQSPAMDNLNAPVGRPPVAMRQMGSNQGQPGNPQFGQGPDPRFSQPGGPGLMPGNPNMPQDPAIRAMLAQLDPEQRQKFRQLPPDKLNELFSKWKRTGMVRPGQPQQGIMAMNPPNPAGTVNPMGNPMQPHPQGGGMGPQMQQSNFENQMNRFQGPNALQGPQAQMIMDNMDLPSQVMQVIPGIPPEAKKWGQFKAWLSQTNAPIPDQQKGMLRSIQIQQFKRMIASHGQGRAPQQPGAPNPNAMANLPPNIQIPDVTPQEIQQFRITQQNLREAPEEQIRMFIQRFKIQRLRSTMGAAGQPPPGQLATTAGSQPGALPITSGPQQGMQPGQGIPAPASVPEPSQTPAAGGNQVNRPAQLNMTAPPNPSTASQPKNLKRPGEDLEAPAQSNANDQRPASQPVQGPPGGPIPIIPPEQLAKMTPEQRQKYEQMRNQASEMMRFRAIAQEETKAFEAQRFPDVPMTAENRNQMAAFAMKISVEFNKLTKALNHWFRVSRDEARLRAFIRTRLRLLSQFQSNNTNNAEPTLKENLTMTRQELFQAKQLLDSIMKDLASIQKSATRPPQLGAAPTNQQPPQPAPTQQPQRPQQPGFNQAPAPLNEENLAKQNQALNKPHQRSNSKSGQPPAGSTSSQPPFPIGATSPDGKPLWVAAPSLTQEKLQLPRKKMKTATGQASSPAVSSQNASPQTRVTSPEIRKKEPKAALKPAFMCTEPGCEMAETGFPTEEARKQHHQEAHVRPYEDPQHFLQQSFAAAFGLDEHGRPKPQSQPAPEEVTPTSREASTKQHSGGPGAPGVQGPGAGDKSAAAATGPKPRDKSVPEQAAPGFQQSQAGADALANTTIDPQSLMAPIMHLFDPAAGGVISDTTLYQSTTPPEDTPESTASKDSGVSEPNSDIPETANLEIDMHWQNFDDSTLVNGMAAFGMDMELNSFEGMASYANDDMLITEDMLVDFDKPFTGLDPSLYELNTV